MAAVLGFIVGVIGVASSIEEVCPGEWDKIKEEANRYLRERKANKNDDE